MPSCIRYNEVLKKEFHSGEESEVDRNVGANNIRSVNFQDQYMTQAIFDALWLSPEARSAYIDLYARTRGKDEQFSRGLLRRQLEENKHWISFYVLADVRGRTHAMLSDEDAIWQMYLILPSGDKVSPVSIKEVELNPEISAFFAQRASHYKVPYLVKFSAKSPSGDPLLSEGDTFKFVFSSIEREAELHFGPDPKPTEPDFMRVRTRRIDAKRLRKNKDEDFYRV